VLDHAGNHLRLGRVTDIFHDRLGDDVKRPGSPEAVRSRDALPRRCEACSVVLPPQTMTCPECGAVREAKTGVVIIDGQLVELGAAAAPDRRAGMPDKAAFYGQIKSYAQTRGYASGWAAHKYRERFREWPNEPHVKAAPLAEPSLKTLQWIRSRKIAFAKARAARG
jgi:RNA polymerase subunit RPABC4/transcription elongation factor Spt4